VDNVKEQRRLPKYDQRVEKGLNLPVRLGEQTQQDQV
jgi:hypothetical protein